MLDWTLANRYTNILPVTHVILTGYPAESMSGHKLAVNHGLHAPKGGGGVSHLESPAASCEKQLRNHYAVQVNRCPAQSHIIASHPIMFGTWPPTRLQTAELLNRPPARQQSHTSNTHKLPHHMYSSRAPILASAACGGVPVMLVHFSCLLRE